MVDIRRKIVLGSFLQKISNEGAKRYNLVQRMLSKFIALLCAENVAKQLLRQTRLPLFLQRTSRLIIQQQSIPRKDQVSYLFQLLIHQLINPQLHQLGKEKEPKAKEREVKAKAKETLRVVPREALREIKAKEARREIQPKEVPTLVPRETSPKEARREIKAKETPRAVPRVMQPKEAPREVKVKEAPRVVLRATLAREARREAPREARREIKAKEALRVVPRVPQPREAPREIKATRVVPRAVPRVAPREARRPKDIPQNYPKLFRLRRTKDPRGLLHHHPPRVPEDHPKPLRSPGTKDPSELWHRPSQVPMRRFLREARSGRKRRRDSTQRPHRADDSKELSHRHVSELSHRRIIRPQTLSICRRRGCEMWKVNPILYHSSSFFRF